MEEWITLATTLIPTAVGGVGAFWGIFTYREGQKLKRKEILFPLIDEFDKAHKMFLAKAILDDFTCSLPDSQEELAQLGKITIKDYKHPDQLKELYHVDNLYITLRYHKDEGDVTDLRELCVRESFDAIIDFYAKLEYLKRIGLLKEEELEHFKYYYDKLVDSEAIRKYVTKYQLPLKFSLFK
jgi:hypothetical protein